MDRFKPDVNHKQRLAESFETALDLSAGIAKLVFLSDRHRPDIVFSSRYACPYCNYTLVELTPRVFSFNSPSGACSSCNGLGVKTYFDINKIILNSKMSISDGAIAGFNQQNTYCYSQLKTLAKDFNFSLKDSFQKLSQKKQNLILHGSKHQMIYFSSITSTNKICNATKNFEGVLPYFIRRYNETESPVIKEELSKLMSNLSCPVCKKTRLKKGARHVFINKKNIADVTALSVKEGVEWLKDIVLVGQKKIVAERLLKEILSRLRFLINLGLDYLSLSRQANTLSGGESQRIRLASQIGVGLVGVMYVLDEPSIGLHQRDNQKLLDSLNHLRDIGNTVIMVEHDEKAIKQADYIVDIGPGAGIHGGQIIATGSLSKILQNKKSITAAYLSGRNKIKTDTKLFTPKKDKYLEIYGASGNNLKHINLKLPIGLLTCITGVSGSGKSTLINRTLYPLAAKILNNKASLLAEPFVKHQGFHYLDKVIDINQNPIGRTPRSNPSTYTGFFTHIRELFSKTLEARSCGYTISRFSFNVKGGRCEACKGDGLLKVEMHFLPDMYVCCDICKGTRYNRETLAILYKGKNISEVLNMSVEEAFDFFSAIPQIKHRLQTLVDVGLSYVTLGQNATTLSGGEAQRIKLAKELAKTTTGKILYIFDEPTTGLHFYDIQQLLNVIVRLREQGNTVIIIEHNLDVIKSSDWIIDLGPEGGNGGGYIIAEGSPDKVVTIKKSYTGQFLRKVL